MRIDEQNLQFRIFISSTFNDMFEEREYLMKYIFPKINKEASMRGIDFAVVDLRWGITEDEAKRGNILKICLEEIDRCRPFFIGMIAERYGWMPLKSEIGQYSSLIEQFSHIEKHLVEGKSITEIEILYGTLYDQQNLNNQSSVNCNFFIRSKTLTDQLAKKNLDIIYYEETDEKKLKLNRLKKLIDTLNYPKLEYHTFEMLGSEVYQKSINILNNNFPLFNKKNQEISDIHNVYAKNLLFSYQPISQNLEILNHFLEKSQKANDQKKNLILIGPSGIGKSSLLAYWIDQLKRNQAFQNDSSEYHIIQYYAGADTRNHPIDVLNYLYLSVREMIKKPKQVANSIYQKHYLNIDQTQLLMNLLISEISNLPKNAMIVIVIDGINQIQSNDLNWLPVFSNQVICIVSCISNQQVDQLMSRGIDKYEKFEMKTLDSLNCSNLIQSYLGRHGKKLSPKQIDRLIEIPLSNHPLFLTTILSELNLFGKFELLNDLIDKFTKISTIEELFHMVFERIENDFGYDICSHIFSFLFTANIGLKESELIEILHIPRLKMIPILLSIDSHLFSYQGILSFKHDFFKNFIYQHYIKASSNLIDIQKKLISFFENENMSVERQIQEMPSLLKNTNRLSDLVDFLKRLDVFQKMYEHNYYELKNYWELVKGIENLKIFYVDLLYQFGINFDDHSSMIDDPKKMKLIEQICDFVSFMDQPYFEIQHRLIIIRRWILKHKENIVDANEIEVLNAKNQLAVTLGQASLHPPIHLDLKQKIEIATSWKKESEKLLKLVITQRENLLGKFHIDTLCSIDHLGSLFMYDRDFYAAKPLVELALEGRIETLGLAHYDTLMSLNNLGGVFFSLGDYSSAEKYFKQAFESAKKVFVGINHLEIRNIVMFLNDIYRKLGKNNLAEDLDMRELDQDYSMRQILYYDDDGDDDEFY